MTELHSALKTQVIQEEHANGVELVLVGLQRGKNDFKFSLHIRPSSFTTSGVQTTDLLGLLGFKRSRCAFVNGGECYAREVPEGFDLSAFSDAFPKAFGSYSVADQQLERCGFILERPEGLGFFCGKPSAARRFHRPTGSGDGHTSPTTKPMKESEDESFRYVFTWIEGGQAKGWTTHYRTQHPPISPEVEAAFRFLGLRRFSTCPAFDFEPCHWSFTPFEERGVFESNADVAHRWFDEHAHHFALGVESLLAAQRTVQPFGYSLLPSPLPPSVPDVSAPVVPSTANPHASQSEADQLASTYHYDVAFSFAGTERRLAESLAVMLRGAGFRVFYDDFYPEQLWGKDLPVFFDHIYREASRFCVVLVSHEYTERMWTDHERRSAVSRALAQKGEEYILPIKVEAIDLPGVAPTLGYLSLDKYSLDQIAQMLISKLRAP